MKSLLLEGFEGLFVNCVVTTLGFSGIRKLEQPFYVFATVAWGRLASLT